jgi:hypothetical protein
VNGRVLKDEKGGKENDKGGKDEYEVNETDAV